MFRDTAPADQSVGPDSGCASASYAAAGAPAALLIALDKSGTMASNNKFAFAQQAIVAAIDQDIFNSMSLGLSAFPSGEVAAPACLMGLIPTVTCAAPGLPQVPIALAGGNKSNMPPGVRSDIYTWLSNNAPAVSDGNGNPTYDALLNDIGALKSYTMGKRMLFYITDGGASCTSVDTNPLRSNFSDANGCPDWEDPNNIITLLKNAHDDPNTPINTFVIGVPGADTTGSDPTTQPPYYVRRALSAYALAGSPETVPTGCDGAWSQAGTDPALSCHFDMTQNYSAQQISDAIGLIRNKLIGCTFVLPTPEAGTVNLGEVNVDYSVNGGPATNLKKRSSMTDMCTTDGCWDYTPDNKVLLIGKACNDVQASPTAKVDIVVGCQTITK
jgi:hypothetical protein